jgi:hypothetical protein
VLHTSESSERLSNENQMVTATKILSQFREEKSGRLWITRFCTVTSIDDEHVHSFLIHQLCHSWRVHEWSQNEIGDGKAQSAKSIIMAFWKRGPIPENSVTVRRSSFIHCHNLDHPPLFERIPLTVDAPGSQWKPDIPP